MMYDRQGADEITFLDITATHEGRGTMVDVVRRTAANVFVPLTVGAVFAPSTTSGRFCGPERTRCQSIRRR